MLNSTSNSVTAQRLAMRAHGYSPLPLNGKAPKLASWQNRSDASEHEINAWGRVRPAETNTGLLTRNTPAFDIDILSSAEVADAAADLIAEELRDRGALIVRFGRKPKRAIVCRTNEPFQKIKVELDSFFSDPETGEIKHDAIEILGDGQQLACLGEHPDTKQPYEWLGGSPADVPASALPLITEADARAIVDKIVAMLGDRFGIKLRCPAPKAARPDTPVAEAKTTDTATAWGAAALRSACEMIVNAPNGAQDSTLNAQCYGIGQLVAGGELPEAEARRALHEAAAGMPDHDSSNPWADLTYKVERSFADGKSKPRAAPAVERAEFKFKGGPGAPPATDDPIISIARAYAKARIANGGQHPPLTDELGQVYRTLLPRAVHAAAALIREQVKRGALLLSSWLKLDIPPRDYVLGHVLCTTSRWLIYGETGVGKTLVGLELAAAAASGKGFLNWPGSGIRRRVMYLDGELPAETFKERMELIAERYGADVGLYGYNRDVLDDGEMPALNTPEGDAWLMREIDSVDPDLIVFDSIMCLLTGSMAEEESWAPVKEMVRKISRRRIAQVWLHHTGHDTSKSFGTKTREWEMDTVVSLTKDAQNDERLLMEFRKARLRTPRTREQFESLTITCGEGGWEIVGGVDKGTAGAKASSKAARARRAFVEAYHQLASDVSDTAGLDGKSKVRRVTVEAIRDHMRDCGALDCHDGSTILLPSAKVLFSTVKGELIASGKGQAFIERKGLVWALYPDRPFNF